MSMLGGRSGSDGRAVPAAVHQYPFPCNVSGLAGAEEGDRAPDLLRCAMTFRRDAAGGLDTFGNAVVCDTVFLLKIDRKRVVWGKRVSVSVDSGGRRILKKNK